MARYCKYPYKYYFMTMTDRLDDRKCTTGQAIRKYCATMHISYADLARIVNPFAQRYGCRFTQQDISNYLRGYSPKIDKLTALALATRLPVAYWTGYTEVTLPKSRKNAARKAA